MMNIKTKIAVLTILLGFLPGVFGQNAKNVILMVADGAGYNSFLCSSYFEHGRAKGHVYDDFPVRLACTTWSLHGDASPGGYGPNQLWNPERLSENGSGYNGHVTDSAAAVTALCSGYKTFNGRINIDKDGKRLETIAEIASRLGKSTGTVSTVQFAHATPAGMGAHAFSRNHYPQIAAEMLFESTLDVIIGCGHPGYDDNGRRYPAGEWKYEYVVPEVHFLLLMQGKIPVEPWRFVDSPDEILALAEAADSGHRKLLIMPRVHRTLQCYREGRGAGSPVPDLPDLAALSRAALNALGTNENGFVLMIEGGAVDWANHDNNLPRMLEEMRDFNRAVSAVMEWLRNRGESEQTLLIVTADHETGGLWGEDAGTNAQDPFSLPCNAGQGGLPAVRYFSKGHTNSLVPVYATGPGSERFAELIDGRDEAAAKVWDISGDYVDNTDVFTVMRAALGDYSAPKPKPDQSALRPGLR